MVLAKERKQQITKEFQLHEGDTGSSDVQIAILTERINDVSKHLQKNKKDHQFQDMRSNSRLYNGVIVRKYDDNSYIKELAVDHYIDNLYISENDKHNIRIWRKKMDTIISSLRK